MLSACTFDECSSFFTYVFNTLFVFKQRGTSSEISEDSQASFLVDKNAFNI